MIRGLRSGVEGLGRELREGEEVVKDMCGNER